MKTPLNGIHGMAQVLEPQSNDEAEVIAAILSSSEHLNAVVDSILAFTELSSGEITLGEGQVSIDAVLDRVVAKFQKMARMQGKSLARDGAPTGIVLRGDGARLDLALACLVSNFVSHGGGRCAVSAARLADGTVAIRVRDDGPGIEPEYQARIWQAFGVGQDVHSRRADGIGLGLPLTRRIVELHGGELDLLRGDDGMTALLRLPVWRVVN